MKNHRNNEKTAMDSLKADRRDRRCADVMLAIAANDPEVRVIRQAPRGITFGKILFRVA